MPIKPICSIIDDYQKIALDIVDWTFLDKQFSLRQHSAPFANEDNAATELADCTIIVAMRERTPFPETLLARLPKLRLLITTGAKNQSIDLAAAQRLGITVCGTRSSGNAAAEFTWAAFMAFMRDIPRETTNFRGAGDWQIGIGQQIQGKRLGVVGLGRVGRKIVDFGKAFDMDVCGWTRSDLAKRAESLDVTPLCLNVIFETCDVITLHLVLTAQTHGLISHELMSRMKASAVLINTSRGPVVDEAALINILECRQIGGAVLDVFDQEPLPNDHPFRTLSNVLATPHIGYVTQENYRVYYADAIENITSWLNKTPLRLLTET